MEDLSRDELVTLAKDLNIEVLAKNPGKPNKTELVEAIQAFKDKQDVVNDVKTPAKDTETTEPAADTKDIAKPVKGAPRGRSKMALLKADLFRKERVLITDVQVNQTKEELISISWGNRRLGIQTDFVSLTGEPQYVRRGALANIREATTTVHEPIKNGNGDRLVVKKRFVIQDLDGMTQKELDELANKQAMRAAKYA